MYINLINTRQASLINLKGEQLIPILTWVQTRLILEALPYYHLKLSIDHQPRLDKVQKQPLNLISTYALIRQGL